MVQQKEGFLSTRHFKNTSTGDNDEEPQCIKNDSQLEFHRLISYVKSVQKQIDTLQQNCGTMSSLQVVLIVAAILFLLLNDFMHEYQVVQAAGSAVVLIIIMLLVNIY